MAEPLIFSDESSPLEPDSRDDREAGIVYLGARCGPNVSPVFGLRSVFLLMTLIAVIMAITMAAPGLGIFLGLVAMPPYVRTALVLQRRRAFYSREQLSGWHVVALFCGSMLLTVSALIVCCFGTCVGCAVVGEMTYGLTQEGPVAMTFGLIAGGSVLISLVVLFGRLARQRWKTDVRRPWIFGKEN